MIKPDAVADGHIGAILKMIADAGFKFKALKLTQLTEADAKKFYEVHAKDLLWRIGKFYVFWANCSSCFRKR
jgi:nucleoside diphosphate kinase